MSNVSAISWQEDDYVHFVLEVYAFFKKKRAKFPQIWNQNISMSWYSVSD